MVGCTGGPVVTNAARTLIAVAILAVVVALAVAVGSALLYGATLPRAHTGASPVNAPTVYGPPG